MPKPPKELIGLKVAASARPEDMLDPDMLDRKVSARLVNQANRIVDDHPDEALRVIRGWLHRN